MIKEVLLCCYCNNNESLGEFKRKKNNNNKLKMYRVADTVAHSSSSFYTFFSSIKCVEYI